MKIAIVPVSMMGEQLRLWRSEREVEEAERILQGRVDGTKKARASLRLRQNELFDHETRIATARANIARILKEK